MKDTENYKQNLPVVVPEKNMSNIAHLSKQKIVDGCKRLAKVAGGGAVFFAGLGTAILGGPAVATIGGITAVYAGVRAGQNIIHKTEPSLMFMTRKTLDGERKIYQDIRPDLATHMIGFSAAEKAGMMGLQTLVGFSRYKENLKGTKYIQKEDGTKVYLQKYSTVTHTVNLKNFEMFEKLGLIEIENMEENFKNNDKISKALKLKPHGEKSMLIVEKIGFNNWKSLKEIAKAKITGDKKKIEENTVTMKKVNFRLTDKPVDFEDMYLKLNGKRECSKEERVALGRFLSIFSEKRGILAKKGIDIKKDVIGRDIINYNSKETFAQRVSKENELEKIENASKNKRKEFIEELNYNTNQKENDREKENEKEMIKNIHQMNEEQNKTDFYREER